MEILIIEDEKPAARLLKRKVEQLGYAVTNILTSIEDSLIWFSANKHPELILADIQLADGLSFEIFEQLNIKSAVIFTTAYDEYALRAFKLNSIDYLLKPIDENELKIAIEKFSARKQQTTIDSDLIKRLFQKEYKNRFTIKAGNVFKIIDINEIECFYSAFKSSFLVTKEGRTFPLEESLDSIEKELNPLHFYRVNRQFIISIQAIKEISIYSNSRLKVLLNHYNEEDIIVSRERVQDFKNWIS